MYSVGSHDCSAGLVVSTSAVDRSTDRLVLLFMSACLGCRCQLGLTLRPARSSLAGRSRLPVSSNCSTLQSRWHTHPAALLRSQPQSKQSQSRMQRSSSQTAQASTDEALPSSYDLLVVGPGVLGSYAGILWQQQHPSAKVTGQTNSVNNHDRCQCTRFVIISFYQPAKIAQRIIL